MEKEQNEALWRVTEEYNDIFTLSQDELKYTELTRHVIDTDGHVPVKQLPQRTP